jgi:hypothetical protein
MRLIPIACVALAATACATSRATINSYVDPNYSKGSIHSLAVFPIRNGRFAPSEAQQINREMSMAIHERSPAMRLMSSAEAIRILSDSGLADRWAVFLDNYVTSGVPDANALKRFGQVLGVDAILQGEIVNVYQQDGTFGGNKGTTRVTVRLTMLDAHAAKLLWEASSDGLRGNATTVGAAPPIIEAVELAVHSLLNALPL